MHPESAWPCLVLALLLSAPVSAAELRLSEGTNFTAAVAAEDGRLLMDLLGSIWLVPARGGDAVRLVDSSFQASRPRWSADSKSLLFESKAAGGSSAWQMLVTNGAPQRITPAGLNEQQADWHPSQERVVFVAARHHSGLDIWERDLLSGLAWRLTDHAGDETAPAWSADGRHLVYVLQESDRWYLMLRRFGRQPQILHESLRQIRAPAWRPDNTLITFLEQNAAGQLELMMLIPSDPPLARSLISNEDLFVAPLTWRDRSHFVYTADGVIKTRHFEDRESRTLPFSAAVGQPQQQAALRDRKRALPDEKTTGGDLIIRASRLFDGDSAAYREKVDVIIEGGRITAIEPQRDRGDALLIDIGDSTVMPGLIDAFAALPADAGPALGASLLAFGVTTLVTPDIDVPAAAKLWQSGTQPGPRVLVATNLARPPNEKDDLRVRLVTAGGKTAARTQPNAVIRRWRELGVPLLAANWNEGLLNGADLLLGTATLPTSPRGRRYRDILELTGNGPLRLVSGLADPATPGLTALQQSPQGRSMPAIDFSGRRFAAAPEWLNGGSSVILGSRPSGLPPGFASQAELLALDAAGLSARDTLAAATSAAADALGAFDEIGRIKPGARADLLLVAGDPLSNPADAGKVIAVVRDGRFYSTASLLDAASASVE